MLTQITEIESQIDASQQMGIPNYCKSRGFFNRIH